MEKFERKNMFLPETLIKRIRGSDRARSYQDFTAKVIRLLEIALESESPPGQIKSTKANQGDDRPEAAAREKKTA